MHTTNPKRDPSSGHLPADDRLPALGSDGARRELVRRIVNSPTFARSERLGSLLTFVCELALKGREAEINEQKIGAVVFGRSQNYDSSVDGIVRSQASRLRQRLDLYFKQEGAGEPMRVLIPRGGYVPVFQLSEAAAIPPSLVEAAGPELLGEVPMPLAVAAPARNTFRRVLPWGLSLLLSIVLIFVLILNRHAATDTTQNRSHPLWGQLFNRNQATLIVAPDSGLVLYHAVSARDVDLKQYLSGQYRTTSITPQKSDASDLLLDLANRRYTSVVDLNSVLSIRDRALQIGSDVSVRYARDLRPNDIKKGTVVLLGAYSANPWIELFEPKLNYLLKDDFVRSFSVENRTPQAGEPSSWISSRDDPERRTFGVIAYVPNMSGDGNALLVEGIGMSGTEAAMEFLNDDSKLLPFLKPLIRPDGSTRHFEILIETRTMDASALQSRVLSWHVLD